MRVKESVLRSLLREVAITGDPTAGQSGSDDKLQQSEVPSEVPISASQQSATQLSTAKPPINDPTYVPVSAKELGSALQAIAEVVPEEEVQGVYLDFIKRVNSMNAMPSGTIEAGGIIENRSRNVKRKK